MTIASNEKTSHHGLNADIRRAEPLPSPTLYAFCGAGLTFLIVTIALITFRAESERFEQSTLLTTQSTVKILRAQTDATIDKIAVSLRSIAKIYDYQSRQSKLPDQRDMDTALVEQHWLLKEFDYIRILDSKGIIRYTSDPIPDRTTSLADRPFFIFHRDNPNQDFLIGSPLLGRISKNVVITFSVPLRSPDGRFAGVAFGSIDVTRFADIFTIHGLGPDDVVVMRRLNGELLWRHPRVPYASQDRVSESQAIAKRIIEAAATGHYRARSPVDGIERLYVFSRLERYPFYVFVGRSLSDIKAEFRRSELTAASLTILLIFITATGTWLVYRTARLRSVANNAVVDSEQRLAYALNAISEGVWDWRVATGEWIYTPHCFEMLGYRTADFSDNKKTFLQDLLHPDDQYAQPLSILADLDQVSHFAMEFRLRALNGDYKWILSRGEVIERNASGKPARIIGTFADITQRKDSEDCLRDNQQQLEKRNKQVEMLNAELTRRAVEAESAVRTKELFLANIGHELRTPLTPIIGFVDLLLNNITDPVQMDWLTSIKRSAHHLLQIINDMLDLTLIEAGRMKIDNLDFPLAALIDDLRNLTSGQLHEKRLAFELTIAPEVSSTLRGDRRRLLQILLNFVNNAIKFTERGTVSLRVRPDPATGSQSDLRFEVSDTGIGIPSELHTRLFSKFVQGDDSFRRKNGGLGLGLSIAKQLAKLMNGEVGFESVVGKGSTFWFRGHFELPATENPARTVEGAPPAPAEPNAVETSLARLEALLANDDSESNRWFGKIESALLGTCDPVLLAQLKTAITHFEYVSAVGLVRELRRH